MSLHARLAEELDCSSREGRGMMSEVMAPERAEDTLEALMIEMLSPLCCSFTA